MKPESARLRLFTGLAVLFLAALLAVAADAIYIWVGYHAAARSDGSLSGLAVHAPVRILRDDRYIAHIRANDEHDLYFAQGYAVAEDRLFQIELLKRYVRGRLAEWFGGPALGTDIAARTIDISRIVDRQWRLLDDHSRANLQAFADGVNAAREREPVPVEFRILHASPEPWLPQDSIAAGFATALELIDPWDDVLRRARILAHRGPQAPYVLYQLTDPAWDDPVMGKPLPAASLPPYSAVARAANTLPSLESLQAAQERGGSNNWAVGSRHSVTGRALLASDPHLNGSMPGVWHLVDLEAPGFHAAGASLPGVPGVVLGHNDRIAWGSTNGTTCSESLYLDRFDPHDTRVETFNVRFGGTVRHEYYRTRHGFVIAHDPLHAVAVDWGTDTGGISASVAFDRLNRARDVLEARAALRSYSGPTQNFVLADTSGAVAYQLAGPVPNDPAWCLRVHPSTDPGYPILDMGVLPHVDPSRDAIVYTANAKTYGAGYPLRLAANFSPPYREARIAAALRSKAQFSIADFTALQSDDEPIVESEVIREVLHGVERKQPLPAELRPLVDQLRAFDGHFDPESTAANAAFCVRNALWSQFDEHIAGSAWREYYASANYADLVLLLRALRENAPGWLPPDRDTFIFNALHGALATWKPGVSWGEANRLTPKHPLALLGIDWLNGAPFPGRGNGYTVHVQSLPEHQQSYRAVWDVGNWDAGGMTIPSGESGEPGSGHYVDQTPAWNRNELTPFPYTDRAVETAARHRLILTP
jgi:penicillin amidase